MPRKDTSINKTGEHEEYLTYVPQSNDLIVKKEQHVIIDLMHQDEIREAASTTDTTQAKTQPTTSKNYEQTNIIRYIDVSLLGRACFNIQSKKWYIFLGTLDDDDILKYAEQEHHSKESDLYRSINIYTRRKREAEEEPGIKEISSSSTTADFSVANGEFIHMLMAGKISVLNRTEKQYRSVKGYTRHWIEERKIFNISREQQDTDSSNATNTHEPENNIQMQ